MWSTFLQPWDLELRKKHISDEWLTFPQRKHSGNVTLTLFTSFTPPPCNAVVFFLSIQQHMPFQQLTVRLNQLRQATCVESFTPLNHTRTNPKLPLHNNLPNSQVSANFFNLARKYRINSDSCCPAMSIGLGSIGFRIQMLNQIIHDFHKR